MKNLFYISILIFAFSNFVFAQIPQPTATPPVDDGDVVKISTTLIQLDVVVTDKDGNQITDLKPEEIEIYENGEKQEITNFSYISSTPTAKSDKSDIRRKDVKDKTDIPIPAKKLNPEEVRRTYALVIDDLGLSFSSVYFVKKSIERFIKEQMREGDLVSIVRTGGGIGAIQSFTSDKNQLIASTKKLKWNPQGRVGISTFEPFSTTLKEDLDGRIKSDGSAKSVVGMQREKEFLQEIDQARKDNFSIGSLGSLNFIIRGMRNLPGRKSVMFFSQGFFILSKSSDKSPMLSSTKVLDAMRLLADTANRSSVVIYTLDPRGLENAAMINAQDDVKPSISAENPTQERIRQFNESQQSLKYLAEETGGFAFYNQNNLNKGLREVIDDQSYYLIGYEPDSETFDPTKNRYNEFEIKVNRPEAKVRYRSGFFAFADNRVENVPKTPAEKIKQALMSPFGANEIGLKLYTISGNDPKSGEFIRSLVNISAKDLKFKTEPNGNKTANFDIIALTFGIDGKPIDQVMKNYTIQVDSNSYFWMLYNGFVYDLPIYLKNSGAYQFRIALRDAATGKVGSASQFIEVPNFKKKRLWVSNLLLESFPIKKTKETASDEKSGNTTLTDTTLREFTSPVTLRYGAMIYNAKTNGNDPPKLLMQTRLISNGKIILESKLQPVSTANQTDFRRIDLIGAFTLGTDLPPGDYIFQIIVTDELAKEKNQTASQWIDFELIRK